MTVYATFGIKITSKTRASANSSISVVNAVSEIATNRLFVPQL